MKYLNNTLLTSLLFFIVSMPAFAGMRCANGYITTGDNTSKVLTSCGPPNNKQHLKSTYQKAYWPKGKRQLWLYEFDKGTYTKKLLFIDNKLVSIENGPRLQ